jgi:ATP adenylyltransferase
MSGMSRCFERGTLWVTVKARTAAAIAHGAIQSIPTQSERVAQGGVNFLIRMVSNLARKAHAKVEQQRSTVHGPASPNPFLPYDPDLFVTDISDTHVCLLNKFNVLDYHVLMVTRSFQEQESLLTQSDFEALLLCLSEYEGLAFYNSGEAAGASQRHKHLQMVPLPLMADIPHLPIEPLLHTARFQDTMGVVPSLPFLHVVTRMNPDWIDPSRNGAPYMLQQYLEMLRVMGVWSSGQDEGAGHPGPYNILVTRQWMFLVPRSKESYLGISVNALGFAGGLLVRDEEQLAQLKKTGPMRALQHVGLSPKSP